MTADSPSHGLSGRQANENPSPVQTRGLDALRPRERCRACRKFGRWGGGDLCLWCVAEAQREAARAAAVAARLAELDEGDE